MPALSTTTSAVCIFLVPHLIRRNFGINSRTPSRLRQFIGCAELPETTESSCNTACAGNPAQGCGGGGVLSLYYSSAPVGPQPNPGVDGWSYSGCLAYVSPQMSLLFDPR